MAWRLAFGNPRVKFTISWIDIFIAIGAINSITLRPDGAKKKKTHAWNQEAEDHLEKNSGAPSGRRSEAQGISKRKTTETSLPLTQSPPGISCKTS